MGSAAPWRVRGEEKREAVREMFADVAPTYDRINGIMCVGLHRRWRAAGVRILGLKEGDGALDVCCGTGDFMVPLSQAVGTEGLVVGVDFCPEMLVRTRDKVSGARLGVGDACRLPVATGVFDAVSVGWGLRNVPDVEAALAEVVRVLKPGGRFVCLEMTRPKSAFLGRISEAVFHKVVPLIGRVFGKSEAYTYLPKSTLQFLSRDDLGAAMETAGLREVQWRDFFFGNVAMHWGVKT